MRLAAQQNFPISSINVFVNCMQPFRLNSNVFDKSFQRLQSSTFHVRDPHSTHAISPAKDTKYNRGALCNSQCQLTHLQYLFIPLLSISRRRWLLEHSYAVPRRAQCRLANNNESTASFTVLYTPNCICCSNLISIMTRHEQRKKEVPLVLITMRVSRPQCTCMRRPSKL